MPGDGRIFSPLLDGSVWVKPDTVSQRYERMCARIGWEMHIHQLRHYSATELKMSGIAFDASFCSLRECRLPGFRGHGPAGGQVGELARHAS